MRVRLFDEIKNQKLDDVFFCNYCTVLSVFVLLLTFFLFALFYSSTSYSHVKRVQSITTT